MRNGKALLFDLLLPLGVGGLAALLTGGAMEEYGSLHQPPLSPPGWVFPVVWTVLYLLMGLAAHLVRFSGDPRRGGFLWLYGLQLALNFGWTVIFFLFQGYLFALVWLGVLWCAVLCTMVGFFQVRPAAGWLLVPYLMWVGFAGYLNAGVWLLNP